MLLSQTLQAIGLSVMPKTCRFSFRMGSRKPQVNCRVPIDPIRHREIGFMKQLKRRNLGGVLDLDSKERLRQYLGMRRTCASKGASNEGKAIHGQVVKSGINLDSHLLNSLVNVYAKCGSYNYACKVVGEIPKRDVVSWTALIFYGFDGWTAYPAIQF